MGAPAVCGVRVHAQGSLADQLRDDGPPLRSQALLWLAQAADAIDYAHGAKVVHRDIKPANLLLDADGNLSVADFGVSRLDGKPPSRRPATSSGTAGYLAPEQIDGRGATPASDRFALGVVAYQLLTGRLPSADRHELSAPVDAVFERALADEPKRRYPTADPPSSPTFEHRWPPTPLRPCLRKRGGDLPQRTTPGARPLPASRPAAARHRQRGRLWRVGVPLLAALAVAAPATAGGARARPKARGGASLARAGARAGDPVRGLAVRRRCEPRRGGRRRRGLLPLAGRDALRARERHLGVSRQYAAARPRQRRPDQPRPHLRAGPGPADGRRLRRSRAADRHRLCHSYAAAGWELRSQT